MSNADFDFTYNQRTICVITLIRFRNNEFIHILVHPER